MALEPGTFGSQVRWILVIAFAFVAVVVLALLADVLLTQNTIHPGVRVAGVDVGGLTPVAAGSKLDAIVGKRYRTPVVLTSGKKTWKLTPSKAGVTFDATSSADDAFAVGRASGGVAAMAERVVAWVAPIEVPARAAIDTETLASKIDGIASALRVPAVDAGVVVKGDQLTVTSPRAGREMQRARADREILAAFPRAGERAVSLRVIVKRPGVEQAEAEAAAATARVMLSKPATVAYGSRHWELSTRNLADTLQFGVVPVSSVNDGAALVPVAGRGPATSSADSTVPVALGPYFSPTKLAVALGSGLASLGRPAKDAYFDTKGGTVTIVPSQVGLGPDVKALARDLTGALRIAQGSRSATMRLGQTVPRLTTEKAAAMGIKQRLSTFSTDFSEGNRPRVNNIRTLARAIDGSLIAPGAVWSLNGKVGQRTAAKGYSEANAIVNGKLVPQLGGGICQVATTVFNAIFFSGEPVLERQNHSFYISHYPKGRDATVNWGGADLKFRNDTTGWILIKTSTNSGSVTVSLYGTDPGYKVRYSTGDLKQTTVDYPTQTIYDAHLPAGIKAVKDPGLPGYRIVVTRTVTRNGSVVRKDAFVSHYSPKVEVLILGTKPVIKPVKPSISASSTAATGN